MVCVVSAAVLFSGNSYAPMEDGNLVGSLVHWLWVLGFTLAICKNVALKGRNSTVIDSDALSTVQPNLRANMQRDHRLANPDKIEDRLRHSGVCLLP